MTQRYDAVTISKRTDTVTGKCRDGGWDTTSVIATVHRVDGFFVLHCPKRNAPIAVCKATVGDLKSRVRELTGVEPEVVE